MDHRQIYILDKSFQLGNSYGPFNIKTLQICMFEFGDLSIFLENLPSLHCFKLKFHGLIPCNKFNKLNEHKIQSENCTGEKLPLYNSFH